MIVSVHQPHFLPWLGYLNKIAKSDVFVVLDNVQYRKNYFQNRTVIKGHNGEPLWLTIPVIRASLSTPICEIRIIDQGWIQKTLKTIEGLYSKAPYYREFYPSLREVIMSSEFFLSRINIELLKWALSILKINTSLYIASELDIDTSDPNERLIEICNRFDAAYYIAGKGGRNYINETIFNENDIRILWQDFDPVKIVYPQLKSPFLPGISVVDVLFNVGASETYSLIKDAWTPKYE